MSEDTDRASASQKDVEAAQPPTATLVEGQQAEEEKEIDEDLVTWDGPNDKENPQNYSTPRKVVITLVWVYGNLVTTIASSIWSSGASLVIVEFNTSIVVVTLGVSLFLLGYAVGPPIWGPMSERFGRKWPMTVAMTLFTIFCVPAAVGKNLQTLLVARFFQGAFGSAPLSLAGGGIVDIWNAEARGVAVAAAIGTLFGAPILAPIMGNFIAASHLGWRWTQWLSCIMGGACIILVLFALPETLAPKILQKRAAKLRKSGAKPNARTEFDDQKLLGVADVARIYFARPFALLATEPILVLMTIYQSFIYGILYLVFVSYPIAFREVRHWALGVSALPFLGLLVGIVLGAVLVIIHAKTKFLATVRANGGKVIPEQRLPMMIVGGFLLPIGLFIFGWTSHPDTHWAGMVVGSIPIGMGMYMIFVLCFSYIVDVYAPIANSAVGANTFVRSFFGAGFPLFAPYMYHNLGVDWATSTLAFIAIAMIPIPILFYKFGHRIRSWSKNSVNTA
ncbi:major facilitator superfamily domain-containing protein [Hypoxylon trugodes]|uniref:major facilitator superfamily domain-containing protein n=1 Tax=Hypoxylon trugodes TaxID=326681 RepID=UPI0021925E06|nr:major facilitator superfamily domain-containing protein [Hypoxylon trugodes]KAI1382638.1 major facilitator superfamily domain-containing protein [Hypoxylon trugodes]